MYKRLVLLAAASAVLIMPAVARAAPAPTSPVPFKVTFSGTATTLLISSNFKGKGTATYMGPVTTDGHADVTGIDNSKCIAGVANANRETFADLNGNSLTITSQDVACLTGPGQFHGTGNWVVTGGTGLFHDATGQGWLDGHSDFVAGTFAATVSGNLVLSLK